MKNKLFTTMVVATMSALSTMSAYADEAAEKVLRGARFAATLQHQDLHGHMKKDGRQTPVTLFLRGENIQFQYKVSGKDYRFHMRLKQNQFDLLEIVGAKTRKFSNAKLAEKINKTDLSFEDLSMRFLYWQNSAIVGEEKISGQNCYKVRLINPGQSGDYRIVYAWVHQKYGALMRVVGYNAAGHPLKQFQVTDLMKVGKEYTLKRMRVDSLQDNKVTGTTYLEFDKPSKVSGAQPGR
ncbi:MAG: outer membrane lipoprotein-sorting protein [Akkermansiaceae bacterium]